MGITYTFVFIFLRLYFCLDLDIFEQNAFQICMIFIPLFLIYGDLVLQYIESLLVCLYFLSHYKVEK